METSLLVQKLSERGITLKVVGGELACDSAQPIPQAIMTTINAEKKRLVAFLKGTVTVDQQPTILASADDNSVYQAAPTMGHAEKPRQVKAEKVGRAIPPKADTLPRLPWQLEGLVRAANSDVLPKGLAHLPSGVVFDLAAYTLSCAASYLTNDRDEALEKLWTVYRKWREVN
jgi:hypothetical protein